MAGLQFLRDPRFPVPVIIANNEASNGLPNRGPTRWHHCTAGKEDSALLNGPIGKDGKAVISLFGIVALTEEDETILVDMM
jgi:hypothetical protein